MNLEAIKAKLKQLEEGKPKSKKWKPKDEHTVRVLPLLGKDSEDDIAYTVKWHYGVDSGKPMYCPTSHGDDCEFCDLVSFLRAWKDENGKSKSETVKQRDWETSKKLEAAVKHYVPIVVRKKDSTEVEGPYLWEISPKTYKELIKVCVSPDRNEDHPDGGGYKVLTSLMHGVDLTVTLKKKGEKGNQTSYDLTEVEPRLKTSAVVKGDEAASREIASKVPGIDDVAKKISSSEAAKVFASWHSTMSDSAADTKDSGVEYNPGTEKVASGGLNVEDALQNLLSKTKS